MPQFVVVETYNNQEIEHIIEGDINAAELHYNMLLAHKPTDNTHYKLAIKDINKGINIKVYDSISDSC